MKTRIGNVVILHDAPDASLLSRFPWRVRRACRTFYVVRTVNGRTHYLHRELCGLNRGDGQEVDHIDGDGLNNQRSNLRVVSRAIQCRNVRFGNGCAGLRGVEFDHRKKKPWRARIWLKGVSKYLGSFATAEEAHQVWKSANTAELERLVAA